MPRSKLEAYVSALEAFEQRDCAFLWLLGDKLLAILTVAIAVNANEISFSSYVALDDGSAAAFAPVETELLSTPTEPQRPKRVLCNRCHSLTYSGKVVSQKNPASDLAAHLGHLKITPGVVVFIVDLFDFAGTFYDGLLDIIGDNSTVIVAANKVDILPSEYQASLDYLRGWMRRQLQPHKIRDLHSVHLVSATSGAGVRQLFSVSE